MTYISLKGCLEKVTVIHIQFQTFLIKFARLSKHGIKTKKYSEVLE